MVRLELTNTGDDVVMAVRVRTVADVYNALSKMHGRPDFDADIDLWVDGAVLDVAASSATPVSDFGAGSVWRFHVKRDDKPSFVGPVYVRAMTGKVITLMVDGCTTVASLKRLINDKEGVAPKWQRFVYDGWDLKDHLTLDESAVKEGSTVYLILKLRG